jgi:hypothetical protein
VGIDLPDAYAKEPRAVDITTLDAETGRLEFRQIVWPPQGDDWAAEVARRVVGSLERDETVFIVDGPQALARTPNDIREVERYVGAAGKTPCQLPEPGARLFAGFIRTSINFFNALVALPRHQWSRIWLYSATQMASSEKAAC